MKRVFALVLALSLALLCLAPALAEETEKTGVTMRVASLKGPTTMGLVKLMQDAEAGLTANDYTFAMEGTADAISPAAHPGRAGRGHGPLQPGGCADQPHRGRA